MRRKRKKNKPTKKPPPISSKPMRRQRLLHHTLGIALLRSLAMNLHAGEATEAAERLGDDDATPEAFLEAVDRVGITPAIRAYEATSLYFATLYAVVEFWINHGFEDPAVDTLLLNEPYVEALMDFRHAVFHPTPANDPAFRKWEEMIEEVEPWARELWDAIASYARNWVAIHPHKSTGRS